MEKTVVVAEGASGRVDRYLADALGISRVKVKVALEAGQVRVDGRRAKKGDPVRPGSTISVALAEQREAPVPQPELPLTVLLEDPDLLVLDKPAGMATHPLRPGETGTLANALAARFPECESASPDPRECGLAHRLDIDTSGLVVAARNQETYEALRLLFKERRVEKTYLAAVSGLPGEEGTIDLPIAHDPKDPSRMIACGSSAEAQKLKARPALTSFKVLKRAGAYFLVEARIPTGVTHQIRVHLAAIGAPVLGDTLYGGPTVEGLRRHFLHAARLSFPHPRRSLTVSAESPLPEELNQVLQRLERGDRSPH